MKKSSISSKILKSFLLLSVAALAVSAGVAAFMMFNVRNMMGESGNNIGNAAADKSEKSLISLALADTAEIVTGKAQIIEEILDGIIEELEIMSSFTESLYKSPVSYKPAPIPNYKDVAEGELSPHWFLQPDLLPNAAFSENDLMRTGLLAETYLLGNTVPLFDAVMNNRSDISSIYIQTATGINIQYDRSAYIKAQYPSVPDMQSLDWYVTARDSGGLYISDTYADSAGRGLCVTICTPLYDAKGEFVAVLAFDILICDLQEIVNEMIVGENGYAVLLGNDKVIASPELSEGNEYDLPPFWDTVRKEDTGTVEFTENGENAYVIWTPISVTDWKLACILPVSDIIKPTIEVKAEIVNITTDTVAGANKSIVLSLTLYSGFLVVIIIAIILSTRTVAKKISAPILELTMGAELIGGGDLDLTLAVKTGDEIEELAETFNKMVNDIKNITSERERISAELDVAKQIQASMLPCIFPAFPDIREFDIYATMLPAKEVGGDFYDFFLIDDTHLGIVIADVSGKGVPAALFMVIAKTLIKNYAQLGLPVSEVFTKANAQLCEGNDAGMFVTSFMGIIDIKTGDFNFVNAGHNPPCIKKSGGNYEYMNVKPGFILAGMDDMVYTENNTKLDIGDTIYLYTDGVTEATDINNRLFSEERLIKSLERNKHSNLKELLRGVKADIDLFIGEAPQFDDITMLAVTFKGE